MMPKARETFLKWHAEETTKGTEFNFKKEILHYCRLDVEILEKSCIKFRELFMNQTSSEGYSGIDPFKHSVTLASACNLVFRALYLPENTVPLLPSEGFLPKKQQSAKSLQWLHYMSKKLGSDIEYEYKIGRYHVDGYCKEKNIVLSYNGCLFHGHLACYNADVQSPFSRKSMGQLFQETRERLEEIKNSPLKPKVITVWECQFDAQLKDKSSDAYKIVQEANIAPPLSPRAAFFGGRCNSFKLFHECKEDEEIHYSDFTSLYPSTNKVEKLGVGEVEVIRDNFKPLDEYFGLVQCEVLPPTNLFLPVLVTKSNGKKKPFALCCTCAETEQKTICNHKDQDRIFRGVWISWSVHIVEDHYSVVCLICS